ncbi:MAG TPA: alpha/beta fold hydrolase [Homoserinimonas sp.]|nr:alpha/beta fold hydrolase [Homoserinimonas sp.]
MGLLRRHAVGRPGWWLAPLAVFAATLFSLTMTAFVVTLRVAHLVIVPVSTRPEDVVVRRVNRKAGTVTLSDHPDATVPGRYSLYFSGGRGYAKVGDIVAMAPGTVTRRLIAQVRGTLRAGMAARVSGIYFESPAELGLEFEDVIVETKPGPAPAWFIPANDAAGRWVIQVHGRGADRKEAIRSVPVFRQAGFSSLLISYRNDGVAPDSSDGRYALGDTEWEDVEAAIRFALDRGATGIVLMGWSMGGAVVLQCVTRSPLSRVVRGVILDSPVVDWIRVLDHQAGALRVPGPIRAAAYRLIGTPWGRAFTGQAAAIDLARLDFVARAAELSLPTLLMHSDSDTFVPSTGSRALAELRPDIVTEVPFAGAGHTRLWNYDEERWSRAITSWLDETIGLRRPASP